MLWIFVALELMGLVLGTISINCDLNIDIKDSTQERGPCF